MYSSCLEPKPDVVVISDPEMYDRKYTSPVYDGRILDSCPEQGARTILGILSAALSELFSRPSNRKSDNSLIAWCLIFTDPVLT